MQSPDIKNVEVLSDYKLLLCFVNGHIKLFDMKPYLKYTVFNPLNAEQEFKKLSIIDGAIEWECGADLSTDTLYMGSRFVEEKELKEM